MKSIKMNGVEEKFLKFLKTGKPITRTRVTSKFKLKNPSAAVLRFTLSGEIIKRHYTTIMRRGNIRVQIVTYSM